jgi:integrase
MHLAVEAKFVEQLVAQRLGGLRESHLSNGIAPHIEDTEEKLLLFSGWPVASAAVSSLGERDRELIHRGNVRKGIDAVNEFGRDVVREVAREPLPEDARTAITRACTAAGVPTFSPHDLRHRRVSLLHLGGMPWARIGEAVGHDSATAARTYTHVMADEHEVDCTEFIASR